MVQLLPSMYKSNTKVYIKAMVLETVKETLQGYHFSEKFVCSVVPYKINTNN